MSIDMISEKYPQDQTHQQPCGKQLIANGLSDLKNLIADEDPEHPTE
tara:strand:+ start:366 stop:506 length:141 start_codon:yes stop_codon:yes gene_type:complete